MQVVSVDVDNIFATLFVCHGNVPRKIGKWGTDPSSVHRALSYGEKIVKISPVCPEMFYKCASFLAVLYLTFPNKFCQLWSYWTEFDEILTRFRGFIYAVNAHIEVAVSHSFLDWQSDKCRRVGNFAPLLPLNWLPWQLPLKYREK